MYKKNEQGYAPVLSRPGHLGFNGIEEEQDNKNQIVSPVHPIPFCSFLCLPSPLPFPLVAHLHRRSHSLTHTTPSSRVRPQEDRETEKERGEGGGRGKGQSVYLHTTRTTLYNLLQMPKLKQTKGHFRTTSVSLSACLSPMG